MSGPVPPAPDQNSSDTSELIESIYRIALEPQTYDDFMGQWDDFIQGQIDRLHQLHTNTARKNTVENTEIENHFGIALRLLEQAGRPEARQVDPAHRTRLPQMMFSGSGAVVWHNNAARTAFDLRPGRMLDDFTMSVPHRAQLDALFSGQSPSRVVLVKLAHGTDSPPLPIAFQPSPHDGGEALFMATEVRQRWPESTGALLAKGFALTEAEIDICSHIVEGHAASDIASARGAALGTVRTQIKRILHKTGSATQVELVGLLHATMRLAENEAPPAQPQARIPDSVINVQLAERRMPVETFGDPKGRPIIFFHGMLDGNTMTREMRAELVARGFYLLAPVRPFFGMAEPDDGAGIEDAPQRLAGDIEAMVKQLRIKAPVLMGHMAGAVYSFAAAGRLGRRVRGIVNVAGGVPIHSAAQFATMSVRQRIVALTARYTPRVLPFVIRAGMQQLDNRGEQQFLQSLYEHAPVDMATLRDPELRETVIAGYHFTIAQGHRAFEIDSYHVVRDWSELVTQSSVPVELVHGIHDPVVSIASVEAFAQTLGARACLTRVEDAGQLLFYAQPRTILDAVDRLMDGP
ncbi:alpha/beta hydrolase [Sulfitobacter albidus]|uniref:Alpha/beta hydrolase n=1 Tax=Sulfitobacter albidus TaxID=2829501 RepID=A0A975JGL7_9RHOB|nr:alpha/beta hydrolase [Sulfitobacter albidus]QUJ78149.1 alpha/beta hydrolase [Sulfitobacter albidus]